MDEDDFLTAVGDLRDLLHDIPEWRLPAADWPEVGEALRAARSALGAADTARLQDLVADLELLSPMRMQSQAGPEELTESPDEVNELVHELDLDLDASDDQDRHEEADDQDEEEADNQDQKEAEEGDGDHR